MPSQTGSIDLTAQVLANSNAKDYSDTIVDNLEIGGRNLIGRFNWSATTQGQGADYYTCSGNGTISSNNTDGTTWSFANCQWQLTLAAGTYQFTTEVLTPCETWGSANLQIVNSSGTTLLATGSTVFNNGGILVKALTLSAETTIGIKIKPGKNAVCRFKLEKGTKATDWTPAPEDQEALVSSINPFVIGTQTAATYAWTGNCPELSELKDGQQITYFLPYSVAGSQITASYTTISSGAVTNVGGASLTLTLANNVSSGQIPIWYGSGMSRVTSHYAYGSVLHLTYREDVTMSGTYRIDRGWFADANYNTDTVYSRTLDGGFITGLNGAGSYSLHMKDANGNWTNIVKQYSTGNTHTVYTGGLKFDEVLYNSTWYGNGIVTTSGTSVGGSLWSSYILDFRYSANVVNTDAGRIIARKPVYLVGTVGSDGLFYLDTTKWWTQTLPTSADGKVYLYIGTGYDWYRINLQDKKTAYIYHDGEVKEYDTYLSDLAAKTATNYIQADNDGIKIRMSSSSNTYQHQSANATTFYVGGKKRSQVGADGLHVYVDSTEDEVASFGATARIGKTSEKHLEVAKTALAFTDGSISESPGATNISGNTLFSVNTQGSYTGDPFDNASALARGVILNINGLTVTSSWLRYRSSNNSTLLTAYETNSGPKIAIGRPYNENASDNTSNVVFDYHSMQMVDKEGTTYFYVSDLRDSSGKAEITEEFVGDGSTKSFSFSVTATDTEYTVTVSDGSGGTVTKYTSGIIFNTAPTLDATITVVYYTTSANAKAYTLGIRGDGTLGPMSVAEGYGTIASGIHAHAEGRSSVAGGSVCHAEGYGTTAIDYHTHAEGHGTTANRMAAHAEGWNTTASGNYSHSEGYGTTASRQCCHAEGYQTTAGSRYSHAQNKGTVASACEAQTAIGTFNDNISTNAFEIGNGTSDNARSNAATIDWNGNYIGQAMAGVIQMFAGATPPMGWLVCDGSAISRETYATLFAAIGTTWGAGDGSSTFNIPDLRGRMPMGAGTGSGLTARTLGGKIGAETHNHGGNSGEVTLSAAQSGLPAHTHAFTQPTVKTTLKFEKNVAAGSDKNRLTGGNDPTYDTTTEYTASVSGGAVGAVTGGAKKASSAHKHTISSNANIPPSAVVNFIICTGKTS